MLLHPLWPSPLQDPPTMPDSAGGGTAVAELAVPAGIVAVARGHCAAVERGR